MRKRFFYPSLTKIIFFLLLFPSFIFPEEKIIFLNKNQTDKYYHLLLKNISQEKVCLISNQAGIGELLFVPSVKGQKTYLHEIFQDYHHTIFKILTPEHGLSSQSENTGLETDNILTGNLPVYPAYYKTSQELSYLFSGCEAILYDLPDAGVRPYTYRTILTRSVQAVSMMKNPPVFYLVDHANPARNLKTRGPVVKKEFYSYLGEDEIPFFPGLTYGELLRYYIHKNHLDINIRYISMLHYRPDLPLDNSPLNSPSPSLPHNRSLHCYWLGIFFEGTTIDYGRHTKDPFCMIGHPAIDYRKDLPAFKGIKFTRYVYKPFAGNYANRLLRGYRIEIEDVKEFDPVKMAYHILEFFIKNYPEVEIFPNGKTMHVFDKITGTDTMRKSLLAGTSYEIWKRFEEKKINLFLKKVYNYRMY